MKEGGGLGQATHPNPPSFFHETLPSRPVYRVNAWKRQAVLVICLESPNQRWWKTSNPSTTIFTFTRIIAKLQPLFFVWSGKLCSGKMCKRQTNDGYLDSSNGLSSAEHHSKIKYCTESFTGKVPLWPKFQYYLKILKPIQVRKSSLCYSMIFLRVYLFIHVVNMKFDTWTSFTYAP